MKQIYKGLLSTLILLLVIQAAFAQTELPVIQSKLVDYTKTQLPEKVFLHTDKNFYTAGEIIWFKAYMVDGIFNKPLQGSKVAYVELLDKNNTPVANVKIELDEKGGNGSFQLPLSLQSGHYTIRAYTNWMKNTGAGSFFESTVTIVNALKTPDVQDNKSVTEPTLKLFPEGGNLVNGLPSKVAFHVVDKNGNGVGGKGYLIDSKNDTLASFSPYKFGMGHFDLMPQANNTCRVVFSLENGKEISEDLPSIFENGYTMRVEEIPGGKITVTVRTNVNSDYPELYLMAQTRQVVKNIQKSIVRNGAVVFTIDKKNLDEGISQLTVFDSKQTPVCERLIFVQPTLKNNLNLTTSKNQYSSREKVEFSVSTPIESNSNMSLSVYRTDDLQSEQVNTIGEYIWLTSELNGIVEQPSYYLSPSSEEVHKAADYLMLTHGWRRFKWNDVLGQKPVIRFPREEFGHIITARVTDTRTNEAAEAVQVFLSVPNTTQKLFTANSDSKGIVQFEIQGFYGANEIIAQTSTKSDSFYKVEILTPFANQYNTKPSIPFTLVPSIQNTLLDRSVSMQTQQIYLADSISRFIMPALTDTLPFYGIPLYSYKLDNYVRFNTMEEVLREYVREVNVGVKGSGTSLRFKLYNETTKEWNSDNFLVMIDGIPLMNANNVFLLNPLKIKQLDIVSKNYILGYTTYRGLANFTSYDGTYEGLELDPRAISIDYEGLQLQREFYAPDYSTDLQRNSRLPDLRSTLLWIPNVGTQQMSFYTGDNKGKFLMVLQGINTDGQPISATSQFEVR